ncbi:MAG: 2-oxo acid dehydrogenase subunit E2, partial [Planctomycetota bacterium]
AEKARAGSFEVNDTRGGTFTISNAGAMGGSRYSTPIINHPQAAVLALGRSREQPWVVDGAVVPRLILPLSVSFDHRIIDGAHAIAFMREIVNLLQNPASLMLQ